MALSFLRQFLCWLAYVAEQKDPEACGSQDALANAPVPRGLKRARRVDTEITHALAAAAGKGDTVKSGRKAVRMLHRFRRVPQWVLSGDTGNRAIEQRVASYYAGVQDVFGGDVPRTISLVMDGTRLSLLDMLYAAIYDPVRKVAAWCPPQACAQHRESG